MTTLKGLAEDLARTRDELKLQLHLGGEEAKDEWEKLEKKWSKFSTDARLHETTTQVGSALGKLGEELKNSYLHLRDAIKK